MRAILTYHSIDDSGSAISLSGLAFERHVRWLASGTVSVVGLAQLLHVPAERDAVAITFDDAFTNFATVAWPRLREHGLPVTLFVPTLFVAGTNDWPSLPGGAMPCLPLIDWATLGRLAEEGVSLGAHSRSHPDLRALGPAELQDEIQGSSDDIRRQTGVDPDAFAYPYGRWSPGVVSAVRSAFSRACTTVLRPLRRGEDPHLLPRLDVFYLSGPGRLERFGRGSFGGYLRARAFLRDLGQRARARLST